MKFAAQPALCRPKFISGVTGRCNRKVVLRLRQLNYTSKRRRRLLEEIRTICSEAWLNNLKRCLAMLAWGLVVFRVYNPRKIRRAATPALTSSYGSQVTLSLRAFLSLFHSHSG